MDLPTTSCEESPTIIGKCRSECNQRKPASLKRRILGSSSNSRKQYLKKIVKKKLPITKWARTYDKTKLYYDFVAGVTVGLMLVPQSLAYASLAGLSPEYGLYSSYWSVFLYCVLGTSKDVQIGPVALVAMLVNKYTIDGRDNQVHVTTMALFSGIFLMLMSLFRLQFIINFISGPVLAGFTSAAAIKIATSQLKGMFGLSLPRASFLQTIYNNFSNLKQARIGDCLLSFTCLAIFIALRSLGNWNSSRNSGQASSKTKIICKKVIWFVCTARFTLAVLITTVMSQIIYEYFGRTDVFVLAGEMKSGIPSPKLPLRDVQLSQNETISKLHIIQDIGAGLIMTPLIGFLETIAVAKTLARKANYKVDVTQELFSLGIVNVVGSFFSAFPVAGSFSRSALNFQCDVKTTLGGFFTGTVVLLAAFFLTPWFKYIPKATLSAMIIAAVLPLFEYRIVPALWRTKRADLVPMIITFFFCFYETEVGILVGVGVSLLMFIHASMQLKLIEHKQGTTVTIEIGAHAIYYPSAEQLITRLEKIVGSKKSKPEILKLDLKNVERIDSTSATLIKQFWLGLVGQISGPKFQLINVGGDTRRILLANKITIENEEECQYNNDNDDGQYYINTIEELDKKISNLSGSLDEFDGSNVDDGLVIDEQSNKISFVESVINHEDFQDDTDKITYGFGQMQERLQEKQEVKDLSKAKESKEIDQFAGVFSCKVSLSPTAELGSKSSSTKSFKKKIQEKIGVSESHQSLTRRPMLVELHSFPGYDKDELTALPYPLQASDVLRIVTEAQCDLERKPAFKREFTRFFHSRLSQGILQDTFWWIFCNKYQPGPKSQQNLFNRIAHNYTKQLNRCIGWRYQDTIFKRYPDLLSQAVYTTFCQAFPTSYRQFHDAFKDEVIFLVHLWMVGTKPSPGTFSKWNLKKLEPMDLRRGEKLHADAKTSSGNQVFELQLNEDSLGLIKNSNPHVSNPPPPQGQSTKITKPCGAATRKRHDTEVEPKTIDVTTQKHLSPNNTKYMPTIKPAKESCKAGKGPEFSKSVFDIYGCSPLVEQFLIANRLAKDAGTTFSLEESAAEKTKFQRRERALQKDWSKKTSQLMSNPKEVKRMSEILRLELLASANFASLSKSKMAVSSFVRKLLLQSSLFYGFSSLHRLWYLVHNFKASSLNSLKKEILYNELDRHQQECNKAEEDRTKIEVVSLIY
eukprot:gene9002-9964_t